MTIESQLAQIDKALDIRTLVAPVHVPSALREEFLAHDVARTQRFLEIALAVGLFVVLSFSLTDWLVTPDVFWPLFLTRTCVVLPAGLLTLYAVRKPWLSLYFKQCLICALAVVLTGLIIAVVSFSHAPAAPIYMTGVNIIMLFVVSMVSAPFRLAVSVAVLNVVLQVIGIAVSPFASFSFILVIAAIAASLSVPSLYANWCQQNERRRHFLTTKRDQLRLATIARQRDQLNRLATIDPLTDTLNRRGLDIALEAHIEAAGPSAAICIAMIDIDCFKPYNDAYGHAAGDTALKDVASALKEADRNATLVARLGGEEFAVVWIDDERAPRKNDAESLRRHVASLEIAHAFNPPRNVLTVSIGMADGLVSVERPSAVFRRADIALYEAKGSGKDRVVRYEPVGARQARTGDSVSQST